MKRKLAKRDLTEFYHGVICALVHVVSHDNEVMHREIVDDVAPPNTRERGEFLRLALRNDDWETAGFKKYGYRKPKL